MPFLMNEDEELKKNQESQSLSAQSSIINNPNQPQSKPGGPKQSGSFVNLQKYLDANKENTKAMADKIAGDVDSTAQKAVDSGNAFKANTPSATKSYSQDDFNAFYNDPTKADKSLYSSLKTTGGYTGPESYDKVEGYQDFSDNYQKGMSKLGQTSTEEGRSQLLADNYQRPNYTKGSNQLDQSLLQRDDYAKNKILSTGSKFKSLESMLNEAAQNAGNQINANKGTALKNKETANKSESEYVENFLNPIKQKVAEANDPTTGNAAKNNAYYSDITDTNLDEATLQALGLKAGENTYGLNLGNYFTYDNSQVTEDNVATPEERARWIALQNLIDGNDTRITDGDKSIKPYSFNLDKFRADQTAKRNELVPTGPNMMTAVPEKQDIRGLNAPAGTGTIQSWLDSGMSPEEWVDMQLSKNYGPNASTSTFRNKALGDIYNYVNKYKTILRNK